MGLGKFKLFDFSRNTFVIRLLREATRDKKQLDLGFLLDRLDPPLVFLDMFEELFFPASYQAGKNSSTSLDFGQALTFSWKMSKL